MEQEKNKDTGVSLGEIFSYIWKQKILLLITTFVVAIIIILGVVVVYNPSVKKYRIGFQYSNVPNLEDGSYLDGSRFNYLEIVSEESLTQIIEGNEAYASLSGKTKELGLEIAANYTYAEGDTQAVQSVEYSITASQKHFKTYEQAESFLKELVQLPLAKTQNMVEMLDYSAYLSLYDKASSYEKQIDYLRSQRQLIIDGYQKYISAYGDMFVDNDGTKILISQLQAEVDKLLPMQDLDNLEAELRINGYISTNELENERLSYENQRLILLDEKETLQAQRDSLNVQLEELCANLNTSGIIMTDAVAVLVSQISEIDKSIITVDKSITEIDKKLNNFTARDEAAIQSFEARLKEMKDKLTDMTSVYTQVSKEVYQKQIAVYYTVPHGLSSTGGIHTILAVAGALVIGLIFGAIVSGAVGCLKEKKKSQVAETI